ncbi:MAG: hypothetical protein U9N02_07290 [Campylobacterota bacterium]|nr:hypothetical protein [Campylobacterota bacterium]
MIQYFINKYQINNKLPKEMIGINGVKLKKVVLIFHGWEMLFCEEVI